MSTRRSIKDMSEAQRREYKRRRRLRRKIQVYTELGLIVIGIILVVIFSVHILKKDSKSTNKDAKIEETIKKEEKGLKVSSGKKPRDTKEDEIADSDKEESNKSYYAKATDKTAAINIESVVSPYGILINVDSGEIVAQKNAEDKIYPASMTKIMTVYTAAKHISEDDLGKAVTMSHEAVDYAYAHDCSTSGFQENETVTVKDLFYGTILPSGGDAAIQLALYVSGDVETFVGLMNEEAKNLGLSDNTHFTNPVGVYDDNNTSTVYDIAMILEAALDDKICGEVLGTKVYESAGTSTNPEGITISNWFLRRIEDQDFGGTILGAKTGYVVQSGSCAASAMKSNGGTTYICCTAGSESSWRCIYDHCDIYKTYGK